MKPVLISSGEPAGIGPDICLALAHAQLPIVILGDKRMLARRAKQLHLDVTLIDYDPATPFYIQPNTLYVHSLPCQTDVEPGKLNVLNAPYVLSLLDYAVTSCLKGEFAALVTAPVHKGIINQANITFTGHTEFLAQQCNINTVVMMLACDLMKVALITTHLPLKKVASTINSELIADVISRIKYVTN